MINTIKFRLTKENGSVKSCCTYESQKEMLKNLTLLLKWNPESKFTVEVFKVEEGGDNE